jgi:hypothetical protein
MTGIFEWIPTLHAVRAVLGAGEEAAEDVFGQAVIYAGAGSITLGLGAWNWVKAGRPEDGTRGRDIAVSGVAALLMFIGALTIAVAATMLWVEMTMQPAMDAMADPASSTGGFLSPLTKTWRGGMSGYSCSCTLTLRHLIGAGGPLPRRVMSCSYRHP